MKINTYLADGTTTVEQATSAARAQIELRRRELNAHLQVVNTLTGISHTLTQKRIAELRNQIR